MENETKEIKDSEIERLIYHAKSLMNERTYAFPETKINTRNSTLLDLEFKRIEQKIQMEPFDADKYKLPIPSDKATEEDWSRSLDNAVSQYEQQNRRIANLNLLAKHGREAWCRYAKYMEDLHAVLKSELNAKAAKIDIMENSYERAVRQNGNPLLDERVWKVIVENNPRIKDIKM